jgi:hypothetical protein
VSRAELPSLDTGTVPDTKTLGTDLGEYILGWDNEQADCSPT